MDSFPDRKGAADAVAHATTRSERRESEEAGTSSSWPDFEEWAGPATTTLGPYRLVRPLGRGGMGIVYLAAQDEPVRRQVAVKVIGALRLDRTARRRFAAEQQALARLNHPNVARLYESGTTPEGSPYFVMELVEEGEPITAWCDARRLDLGARLQLFRAVCEGVRHAHQKGVLHRDLKPTNVLVTELDGRAVPKVIDFGVAEALDRPLVTEIFTCEKMVGTPLYLAPECFEIGSDLDTRADVYALGVLLFELVAGTHPIADADSSLPQLLARIVDTHRPPLSARFCRLPREERERISADRDTTPPALRRRLQGELEWIAAKAVRAERDERYPDVAELAGDVDRMLRQEPVHAGPPSRAYRLKKWIHRNRPLFVAGCLLVASLVAGIVARGREARRANEAAAAAHQAMVEAQQTLAFLVDLFSASEPQPASPGATTARELLDRGAARLEGEALRDAPLVRARLLATVARVELSHGMFREALPRARQALVLQQRELAPPHADLASTCEIVGRIELALGDLDAAERALGEALSENTALYGGGSPQTAAIRGVLAELAELRKGAAAYGAATKKR